ncbi:hypothetical protein [Streptomyces sp. NPDC101455]|uniref:hypothetical protein n=1 Tax=Streptomyces sp. NPDC101455 TaxID=3366142 RepID=UPI0037F49051
MKTELLTILNTLSVEDHVTATGTDTRGHNVTRTGYLLAPPLLVNARRNGFPTNGWRLFVGAAGTNPGERTTWVTLFPDAGSVECTPEPEAGKWSMTELRHVPGVRATSHATRILYGGKGGARSTGPSQAVPVTVTYGDDGLYALWEPTTDKTHAVVRLSTKIWWAHLPEEIKHDAPSAPASEG